MNSLRRWAITFFAIVVIGSMLSALIPPMQSPDENDHIKRAYLLSVLSHTMTEPGRSTGGYFDDGLQKYQTTLFNALSLKRDARVTRDGASEAAAIPWAYVRHYQEMAGSAPYFPLGYLPQAAGLRVGQALHLTVGTSYRIARAATLVAIAGIIACAFTVFPPNALVLCLLALPMTMFQMSSASADGLAFAWTVLAASLFRRGMERGQPFPVWCSALLIVAPFMIATSRPQMVTMLILAPVVLLVRRDRRALTASIIGALLAVGWIAYATSHTVDLRWPRSVTSKEAAAYYLHHSIDMVAAIWRTVTDPDTYHSYFRMFIGVLGWLDRPMPEVTYSVAGAFLLVASVLSFSRRVDAIARTILLLAAVSAVLLTFIALLVTWTELNAPVIIGVQGRYFTAPAILAAYALSSAYVSERRNFAAVIICGAFIAFSVSMTVSTLLWKYYL